MSGFATGLVEPAERFYRVYRCLGAGVPAYCPDRSAI